MKFKLTFEGVSQVLLQAISCFVFLLIARDILIFPFLGVADNGDFWRFMYPAGIDHLTPLGEDRDSLVRSIFKLTHMNLESMSSSTSLFILAARGLDLFRGHEGSNFEIRSLAVLYLMLIGIFIIWRLRVGCYGAALVPLILWCLADPGFFPFLNSFYGEGTLVTLYTVIALIMSHRALPFTPGLLILTSIPVSTAKPQFMLTTAILLVCLLSGRSLRIKLPGLVLFSLVALYPIWWHSTNNSAGAKVVKNINIINATSFGPLLMLPEQERKEWIKNNYPGANIPMGKNFFEMDGKIKHNLSMILDAGALGHLRLLDVFRLNPGAFFGMLHTVDDAIRKSPLNGKSTSTLPEERWAVAKKNWTFASLRYSLFGGIPYGQVAVVAASLVLSLFRIRKESATMTAQFVMFSSLFVMSQWIICLIGDGYFAYARHLLSARFAADLLFVFILWDACSCCLRKVLLKYRTCPGRTPSEYLLPGGV